MNQPTLVVGYGQDPADDHVLAVAVDLARRLRARMVVVHVLDLDDFPPDSDAPDWEDQGAAAATENRHRVERALAGTGVEWSSVARRGDPATELTRAAADHAALMIVVGTRGEGLRSAVSRLLNPSVSHGVIARDSCPVLVVPRLER
jgi:nucleotide-binding universal stress UspA family protein